MKEVLVNQILNPPDFALFVCSLIGVLTICLTIQELSMLGLKVFNVIVGRRVAIQELPLEVVKNNMLEWLRLTDKLASTFDNNTAQIPRLVCTAQKYIDKMYTVNLH